MKITERTLYDLISYESLFDCTVTPSRGIRGKYKKRLVVDGKGENPVTYKILE